MLGCPEADSPFLYWFMKKVAILGRRGSFHEEAALAFYQDIPLELKGFDSFEKMLAAYDSADVDAVVVAVENTLSGGLVRNLELIHSGGYQVVGEVHIPIHQYLMALPGESLESIREVRSHEMALYQTRSYLEKNLPGVPQVQASSTVAAAQEIADGPLKGVAAVPPGWPPRNTGWRSWPAKSNLSRRTGPAFSCWTAISGRRRRTRPPGASPCRTRPAPWPRS